MPFDQVTPRTFNSLGVRQYVPASSGVYGISNAAEWIYVGETDNLRDALLAHTQEAGSDIQHRRPTGFVFEACDRARRIERYDRLIREYSPVCNRNR